MDTSATIFLLLLLTGFGLLQLSDRRRAEEGQPFGWWSVLASPKLLVAPVGLCCLTWLLQLSGVLRLFELGVETSLAGLEGVGQHSPEHWILSPPRVGLFVASALFLGGFIGQLSARAKGEAPDASAFVRGLRQHSLSVMLAQTMAYAWLLPCYHLLGGHAGFWTILYQAPSLVLAPIFAAAARNPGRPYLSLREAFFIARYRMHRVVPIFLVQAVGLSLLWVAIHRAIQGETLMRGSGMETLGPLALHGSALGFNELPLLALSERVSVYDWSAVFELRYLAAALGALGGTLISAVCISRYHALPPPPGFSGSSRRG